MARFQRGSLRVEPRKKGDTWVLRYYTTRELDGRRVENKVPVGLVSRFPSESSAWAEVAKQQLNTTINQPESKVRILFADLARHYMEHELGDQSEAIDPKSHTTVAGYKRVIKNRVLDKWGNRLALGIEPMEVLNWLRAVKREDNLENPTLDRMRRVMSLIFKHGQRYGLIPRTAEANPMPFVKCKTTSEYEAMILTPPQAFELMSRLQEPERTLTLLAASTGLRISECLGLQWQDVSFAESKIYVRRTWTDGEFGKPKSKASKAPVPLHALLAEFMQAWKDATMYSQATDWVFPSYRCHGKQPRTANMLVEDHLRPAAAEVGILSSSPNAKGEMVENDPRRFGFHNLRHSLASFLVRTKTDPKTVQALLRHADVKTTLQLYAHSISEDRLAAQGQMLGAILQSKNAQEVARN